MLAPWIPRRYEPGDDAHIDELLKLCHGRRHPGLEYWSWVFKGSPLGFHGPEGDIWVAEAQTGTLIGYHGRVRVPMWFRGQSIVGSYVCMLATHPDYRRQGVFRRLSRSALQDAAKNGIGVTFGFPNAQSFPGSLKNGSVDFGRVRDLICMLNPPDFLGRVRGGAVARGLVSILLSFAGPRWEVMDDGGDPAYDMIPGFPEDVGTVWDSLKHRHDLGIERTKMYLAWRYHRIWGDYRILSAVRGTQTLGYVVFRTAMEHGEQRGRICELISAGDDMRVYRGLLKAAVTRCQTEGAVVLSASAACSQGCRTALRAAGFRYPASILKTLRGGRYGHLVGLFLQGGQRVQPGPLSWYHSIGDRDAG